MSEPKPKKSKEGKGRHVFLDNLTFPSNVADHQTPICLPTKMSEQPYLRSTRKRDAKDLEYLAHPCRIISRYNFKGGVGKTTSTFSLGYKLAGIGQKVMLVDADAQCNLTQLILRRTVSIVTDDEDYDAYFRCTFHDTSLGKGGVDFNHPHTIAHALAPVLSGHALVPAQLVRVGGQGDLFLLAGDARLQSIESRLARAVEDGALKDKLGLFYHMILMTAHAHKIDTVIIDLPPSLGAMTRVAMMSSDYLMIPYTPDFFSYQAVRLLTTVLCADENGDGESSDTSFSSQPLQSPLQSANVQLSTEIQESSWLDWLTEKQLSTRSTIYALPRVRVLKKATGKQPHKGPRLLGGHLTRFVESKKKDTGKRKLVVNAQHWQRAIRKALRKLNRRLPAQLRMPMHADGRVEQYWPQDTPGADKTFEEWHHEFGLTVGRAAEYYQLSSISQRESLPVLALVSEHIKKVEYDSARDTHVFKRVEKLKNALQRVQTDGEDYADMVTRIQQLFAYFDRQQQL